MEKKKILGMPIALFVIGLVVLGGASAVLATYLSNTVTATATVQSPIELKIGTAWNVLSAGPIPLGSLDGGESIELYVSTYNKADVPIQGTMWTVVSNPDGIVCAEFASLSANVLDYDGVEIYQSSAISCIRIDDYSVRLKTTPSEPWTWAANYKDIAHITVVFEEAAFGTYTVNTFVAP